MRSLNRRQFLQLAGIAVIGSQLPAPAVFMQALIPDTAAHQGRALEALRVYNQPGAVSQPIAHLWPDSVVSILDSLDDPGGRGGWYRTPDGYAPRPGIQPMKPYHPAAFPEAPDGPFWAEVAGPVASIRQHCHAAAPLVTRIGHGGVVQIMDYLPDTPTPWYGVAAADGGLLGWTQAVRWQPVFDAAPPAGGVVDLEIDTRAGRLTAWQGGQAVLQAPCCAGRALKPGVYRLEGRQMGGQMQPDGAPQVYHGVPWRLLFDAYDLAGVYWHNSFGAAIPGAAIQVTPLLAQWLYGCVSDRSRIAVV